MGGCLLKWMQLLGSKGISPLFFTDMHDETLEKRKRGRVREAGGEVGLGGWSSVLGFYLYKWRLTIQLSVLGYRLDNLDIM